jgi:predicted RecA/RadA family phage recombinase
VAAEKDSTNMAKNYLHEGWTIAVPAPTGGVHSGDPILVGGFFGVANYDAEQTLPVEITLGGVWQLPKATTVTFAVGAAVYFDATAGNVTSVSTRGNKLIGAATQCAGASDAREAQRSQRMNDFKIGFFDCSSHLRRAAQRVSADGLFLESALRKVGMPDTFPRVPALRSRGRKMPGVRPRFVSAVYSGKPAARPF